MNKLTKKFFEEYEVDFSKFMKKIQEVEQVKNQTELPKPTNNPLETPQRKYMEKYSERAINRIYINKKG